MALNPQDGERYGLQHGDRVRIITPGGQVVAQISLLNGVMPGVIAIEHGYGHREMGATQHSLDGVPMPYDPQIRAGINLNDLGFADPTRTITNTGSTGFLARQYVRGCRQKSSVYNPGPESDIVLFRRG